MRIRTQLTLFVPVPANLRIESLRQQLDPIQAGLIAAHVTLCREDEIAGMSPEGIGTRLRHWPHQSLRLVFGPPERFDERGVLQPCQNGLDQFQNLRKWVLQNDEARPHHAHLTLAHPRNPRAPGNTDDALRDVPPTLTVDFATVTLIEQIEAGPWRTVLEFTLGDAADLDR